VETAEMARALLAYGCDEAQGYHYGRPMPAEELSSFLRGVRSQHALHV
jgi:EAL domain-containing protein (putative c-di-GMP-specific phosphodiesterase class I)